MSRTVWRVDIEIDEKERLTQVDALLEAGDLRYRSWGRARRNPVDPERPQVGDEIAVARALENLAMQLRAAAEHDIEVFEGHPVEVTL